MTRHFIPSLAAGAIAVAVISAAPAPSFAFDYVTNGGFENATNAWNVSGGALTSVQDASAVDGTAVGRLTIEDGSTPALAEQLLAAPAAPGHYHLSLYLRETPGGNPATVRVELRGGDTGQVALVPLDSNAWQAQSVDFSLIDPGNLLVMISVSGNPGDAVDIDDVSVDGVDPNSITPSPTPTAAVASLTAAATTTFTSTPSATATATRTPTPTPDDLGPLRNGNFESTAPDGSLVGWQHYGGSLSVADTPVHGGGRSARLESSTGSTKWLYQPVAIEPGATYAFSAWLYDDDPAVSSAFLRISWYASSDATGTALRSVDSTSRLDRPAAGFRSLTTGSVDAPADAHSARVRIMLAPASAAPAALYVDDAAFGPAAPAPPTAAAGTVSPNASGGTTSVVLGASRQRGGPATNAPAALQVSGSRIVINEVFYDTAAPGSDAGAEWIELYNAGDADQDVTGWRIEDNAAADAIPPLIVPAGGYAIIAASDSFRTSYASYAGPLAVLGGRIGNSLGNDGDRLALNDGVGHSVDALSWGKDTSVLDPSIPDVPAGHSFERRSPGLDTDSAADFVDNLHPSPGTGFTAAASAEETNPQQAQIGPSVPIVVNQGNSIRPMLLWLVLGSASTLAAAVVAWRLAPFVRERLSH